MESFLNCEGNAFSPSLFVFDAGNLSINLLFLKEEEKKIASALEKKSKKKMKRRKNAFK